VIPKIGLPLKICPPSRFITFLGLNYLSCSFISQTRELCVAALWKRWDYD